MNRRQEILSTIGSVVAIPPSTLSLLRALQNPEAGTEEICVAMGQDPGMTSNLLRLANSSYFGMPRSVGSVREAVFRVGTRSLFKLAVAALATPVLSRHVRGYDLSPDAMLRHSVAVGVAAESLARELGRVAPTNAFTAGILHDIGKILLGTFLEVEAEPILALAAEQHLAFDEAERQALGIDHAEAGAALLDSWLLPPDIIDAVRRHHRPEDGADGSFLLDLVHVADQITLMGGMGNGIDGLQYRPSAKALARLGMTNRLAEKVLCQTIAGLEGLGDFLRASN